MQKKQSLKGFKWIIYTVVILFLFMGQQSGIKHTSAIEYKQEITTMSHAEIVLITEQFKNALVQKIDDDNKVINYDTKESLYDAFDQMTTKDVAMEYYYREQADGLYIIPTELPPLFNKENKYNVIQLANNHVKIVQENQSDLYGNYIIEYEFTFDTVWKITKINQS